MIHQPRFKFRFYSVFYIPLFLLYMEVIFHAAVFGVRSFLNLPGIFLILGLGLFLGLVISLFPERPQYILIWIVQILAVFLFCAEIIYYSVFQQFLAPFSMLGVAGQALDFMDVILKNIGLKLAVLLLFLLPLILYGIFGRRKITWHRIDKLEVLPLMAACVLLHGGALLLLHTGSHSLYSNYDIYYHNVSSDMTAEAFGVCAMTRLDGKYALFGAPSKTLPYLPRHRKLRLRKLPFRNKRNSKSTLRPTFSILISMKLQRMHPMETLYSLRNISRASFQAGKMNTPECSRGIM